MTNVYDLNTLKKDLDREFAPAKVSIGKDEITLRNLMRINENDRKAALGALKEVEKHEDVTDEDQSTKSLEEVEALTSAVLTVLKAVAENGKGDKLVDFIDGDLMLAMKIMELWTEATQPGEAENSSA